MMHRFHHRFALSCFAILIALFSISVPTVRASSFCGCYFSSGDCKEIYLPLGVDNDAGCKTTCKAVANSVSSDYGSDIASVTTASKCSITHSEYLAKKVATKAAETAPATKDAASTPKDFISPTLNVPIPDLTFSKAATVDCSSGEGKCVKSNFLSEYLNALYKYLIGISFTFAVVMVMIGGLQYVLASGGNSELLKKAKKRMTDATVGLILLLGVYTILFTVNPQMVLFKALEVEFVPPQDLTYDYDSNDSTDDSGNPVPVEGGLKWCDENDPNFVNMETLCGKNKCAGIKNVNRKGVENYLRKDTAQALMNAGKIADKQGYYLSIRSKCRSLATQQKLADSSPNGVKSGVVAKPGGSPHSYGVAVDLVLMEKGSNKTVSDGKMSGAKMCLAPADGVAKLSQDMYSAGFARLGIENWHFEYPPAKPFCRKKSFTGLGQCVTEGKKPGCPAGS